MNIIQGRGNSRKVIALPHGSIFAQAAKNEPDAYRQALGAVLSLTLENPNTLSITTARMGKMIARTARLPVAA